MNARRWLLIQLAVFVISLRCAEANTSTERKL